MNKRFSTLLAAALVAGGFSFNAMATAPASPVAADYVKDGSFIFLTQNTSNYLTMSEEGALKYEAITDWAGKLSKLNSAKWQVAVTEHAVPNSTPVYTYSFVNKLSGQALTIGLQSNVAAHTKNVTANEATGNTDWSWDTAVGLYAVKQYTIKGEKVDSVYVLDVDGSNIQLKAYAGLANVTAPSKAVAGVALSIMSSPLTMTADDFNNLLTDGQLYFPGANVSDGQKNVLAENKWEAKAAKIASDGTDFAVSGTDVLFLTNGLKHKGLNNGGTAQADKYEYLVVDYKFHDNAKLFNQLTVDTVALEPASATESNFAARTKLGKRHPATAAFVATYRIDMDSLILTPQFRQGLIPVTTTLASIAATVTGDDTKTAAVKTAAEKLKTAVAAFSASGSTANTADTKFTACTNFGSDGAYDGSTGSETGASFIVAVEEAIATAEEDEDLTDKDKAYIKTVKTFLSAIDGLVITKAPEASAIGEVATTTYAEPAYVDGYSSLAAPVAISNEQVVIRELAGVKVLTVGNPAAGEGNTVLTIKTAEGTATIGGNAEITEGLYYIKDMRKIASGKANEAYGLFLDASPVNPAKYIAKEQAFNPYAMYMIKNAAGSSKGNYVITNLAANTVPSLTSTLKGVTNKVSDGVYAIGKDTFAIVAAPALKDLDKNMGYKYITANDAKNNKFTITSAADVLAGQSIVMSKDSTLKVATPEDEVLYTLVPSADKKYGIDKALVNVTYTIMDADSAFIIKDANDRYVFSNGKYGTKNGTPVQFSMIAVDTDSTFVLYDATNSKKLVVSTQYKTISGEPLAARNDMFIVKPQAAPASYKSLPKHVRIQAINGDYAAVNAKNQGIAVREGDLKADAYDNLDFIFWLDTAHYDNAAPYTYYITKGVKATEEVAASRLYMWNSVDSADAKDANKELPYIYGTGANRVMFRTASIMAQDTLLVPTLDAAAKIDTVSVADGTSKDGLKHDVKAGVKNFQFSFEFASKDAENEYNIVCQNNNGKNYVHNINGVLAMGPKEDAVVVNVLNVSAEDEAATGNETIAANGVKVIASEGQVEIAGAQGKKVVISNILGQVVANTVITSDNAVIAAPQGVVVVAVEGEEAVKAIVK